MNRSERSHAASPSDAMPIARARAAILAIQEIHCVLLPSAPCRHKLSAPLHMAWRCEFDGARPRPDATPWMQSHQSSPRRHILASVALTNATASLRARARARGVTPARRARGNRFCRRRGSTPLAGSQRQSFPRGPRASPRKHHNSALSLGVTMVLCPRRKCKRTALARAPLPHVGTFSNASCHPQRTGGSYQSIIAFPTQCRRRVGASYSYHRNRILSKITARRS